MYLAAGLKEKVSSRLTLVGLIGPQLTESKGVNRVVSMVNATYKAEVFTLDVANKFLFGLKKDTPFVDRHVIRVSNIRHVPKYVSVRTELLRTPKLLVESFLGAQLQVQDGPLKGVYVYPYVNLANGRPDIRFGYVRTF